MAPSRTASAIVGGLMLLGIALPAHAQTGIPSGDAAVVRVAWVGSGAITGVVQDEAGGPIAGAMVSAVGVTKGFAVTDRGGRFEMQLSPGPYLVRAHLSGYLVSRAQIAQVRASVRTSSAIAMRRADGTGTRQVLAAGVGSTTEPEPE